VIPICPQALRQIVCDHYFRYHLRLHQLQKYLGHLDLSTTQIYAETSLRALDDNYIRALSGTR
jgi:integrase/recombinase XerD